MNTQSAQFDNEAIGTLSVTGIAQLGGFLTASLTANDADGAITSTAYQWQISADGSTWANLNWPSSSEFYLDPYKTSLLGKFIRVVVTTTDSMGGTTEFVSASSVAIVNYNTIRGTEADETLEGTSGADFIYGRGGNDVLNGGDGDDQLFGGYSSTGAPQPGDGADELLGGAGKDVLRGGDGDDRLEGGAGDDNLRGDAGNDILDGGDGIDFVSYRFDDLTIGRTIDASQFGATASFTFDDGRGGMDAVSNVEKLGINGTQGDDIILGSLFTLVAPVANQIFGEAGNDTITGGNNADLIYGGEGNDRLEGGAGNDDLRGDEGNDVLHGGAGDDFLDGGDGDDVLEGGSGDDLFYGGVFYGAIGGKDTFIGGSGVDTITYKYTSVTAGITVNLKSGLATSTTGNDAAGIVNDTLSEIENVIGSDFNDIILGNNENNLLDGQDGNDTLSGGGGVNTFIGGGGNDVITGGNRADVAIYTGNRSVYSVTTVAGVITVVDNRPGSPDGTDTLRGMNILRFADSQLFVTAAANRTTLAGVAQTFGVANSEFVTGTAAAERFIIRPGVSAFVSAGTGDTVDLSGAITDYTYKASGNQLQISDGVNTTVLTVGGAFTLRTASGSTPVVLDFAAGGVITLGAQVVGSAGFDPAAAITNAGNASAGEQGVSTVPPTVTALVGSSDSAPTLTGTAVIGDGQALEVTVNGTTYTTANGVALGAGNTWSLTLPSALPAGTYEVQAVLVRAVDAINAVSGTSGADTLIGLQGVMNVYTGGGGNDSITGNDRSDVALYSGKLSDYTVTTVAGVITVVDNRPDSPDGTDTIRGMNILRFADSQLFVTAAANRTSLAGVAQTFEVANSEFVTGTAAAEQFIIRPGVSSFVSTGAGDTVDLSGAITDYVYKASGNQLQISDGVNTTVLTVGGVFTLRTATGSTQVVLDFAAGGVIKLGAQVVGSQGFDAAAAVTDAGNVSLNAIPEAVGDVTSNELVISDPEIVLENEGIYTATSGKVDVFVVDANLSITATIIGFQEGDIIKILNSSDELGISVVNLIFGDGAATLFISPTATINLASLSSDLFGDETGFESIYGSESISYDPIPSGLSMTQDAMSESAVGMRFTPSAKPVLDADGQGEVAVTNVPIVDGDHLPKLPVIAMPTEEDLDLLLGADIELFRQASDLEGSHYGAPTFAEDPFARGIMDIEWTMYPALPQETYPVLVI